MTSEKLPLIKNGELVKKKLTGKLVLRGTCPACGTRLTLTQAEILKAKDACPDCAIWFAVPPPELKKVQTLHAVAEEAKEQKKRDKAKEAARWANMKRSQAEAEAESLDADEAVWRAEEAEEERMMKQASKVIVTTADLKEPYEIVGPVYFQVSNKGLFSSSLGQLKGKYADHIEQIKQQGQIGDFRSDWGFLWGEGSIGQNDFEQAFYLSVQELKRRAHALGAQAVIAMRQDIDMDTTGFQYFYLQMYGTAVRLLHHIDDSEFVASDDTSEE